MEKYKDECEEYQKRLQVEVIRREEVSEKITSSPPRLFVSFVYELGSTRYTISPRGYIFLANLLCPEFPRHNLCARCPISWWIVSRRSNQGRQLGTREGRIQRGSLAFRRLGNIGSCETPSVLAYFVRSRDQGLVARLISSGTRTIRSAACLCRKYGAQLHGIRLEKYRSVGERGTTVIEKTGRNQSNDIATDMLAGFGRATIHFSMLVDFRWIFFSRF